jgi:hypothetical protein
MRQRHWDQAAPGAKAKEQADVGRLGPVRLPVITGHSAARIVSAKISTVFDSVVLLWEVARVTGELKTDGAL